MIECTNEHVPLPQNVGIKRPIKEEPGLNSSFESFSQGNAKRPKLDPNP